MLPKSPVSIPAKLKTPKGINPVLGKNRGDIKDPKKGK